MSPSPPASSRRRARPARDADRSAPSKAKVLLGGTALAVVALSLHCSTTGDVALNPTGGNGPMESAPSSDAGVGDDPTGSSTPWIRVAHLAPEVGAVDICHRIAPTDAFMGPLLGGPPAAAPKVEDASANGAEDDELGAEGDGTEDAGAPAPLAFTDVSSYLPAPVASTVEIAVVMATERSCSNPRARLRIALAPGRHTTFALLGVPNADAGTSELGLVAFPDDPTLDGESARSRFVHAALGEGRDAEGPPSPFAVDAWIDGAIVPLAREVEPRKASTPSAAAPVVDALGYHTSAPLGQASLRLTFGGDAGTAAAMWTSRASDLGMSAGSLHTGFVVPNVGGGYAIVWCDDLTGRCATLL